MNIPQNRELIPYLRQDYDRESLARLRNLLDEQGTLVIPRLQSGLFSAAATTEYSEATNYRAAWVRDNVHVAYAHLVHGQPQIAVDAARALCAFFATQRKRFEQLIARPAEKCDAMRRPHIRFNGETLAELPQTWAHAQNDALGYFVWLYATVAAQGWLPEREWDLPTLALFPAYFRAIEYWNDEDSGHWEESPKVAASSIGAVVAGLRQLNAWVLRIHTSPTRQRGIHETFLHANLDDLIVRGEAALFRTLPAECVQSSPGKFREYDAALLFLVYPLEVVPDAMAEVIVSRIESRLRGPHGIKRYLGDSFYCTDYERRMAQCQDDPTRDFSQDMSARDAMLSAGEEAQWCLFDPLLSVYYGRRYLRTRAADDLHKQTHALNRSLCQITKSHLPRCPAYRCPELYYLEQGQLQTSKSTPLLWTQANLWTALESMRTSLETVANPIANSQ